MANKTGKKPPKSGRKKGKENKRSSQTMELADKIIAETNCHPIEPLLRGAAGDWKYFGFKQKSLMIGKAVVRDNITFEDRISCAEKALKYVAPQLKAVEHSGEIKRGGLLQEILEEMDSEESEEDDDEEDE